MSQAAVEQVLGRLLTDPQFRERFFAGFAPLLHRYPLSDSEREALMEARYRLVEDSLESQGNRLNPYICRADLRPLRGASGKGLISEGRG